MTKRHRWGEKQTFAHKTERQCLDCAIIKVTRRRQDRGGDWIFHRTEFWRGLDQIDCDCTPACEPVVAEATS